MIELGGNIELVGFKDNVDGASLIVLKKIIGNYVRRFSDANDDFEKISIHLKLIHARPDATASKYEVNAKLIKSGKPIATEVVNNNLFFAVDSALKKIEKLIIV